MWYGLCKLSRVKRTLKNLRHRSNLKDRKMGKPLTRFNSTPQTSSSFRVPAGWKFTLLRQITPHAPQNNIYMYNDAYFFNTSILQNATAIKYDPQTLRFTFYHNHSSYCYHAYLQVLTDVSSRFNRLFFLKIRFKGKGYYIYKNYRNTVAPQFGYAHRVYVYAQAVSVKFLSKTKVLLFGLSKRDILAVGYNLKVVKPINIFTGRGVRFARQIIYRKTGKVSSYR